MLVPKTKIPVQMSKWSSKFYYSSNWLVTYHFQTEWSKREITASHWPYGEWRGELNTLRWWVVLTSEIVYVRGVGGSRWQVVNSHWGRLMGNRSWARSLASNIDWVAFILAQNLPSCTDTVVAIQFFLNSILLFSLSPLATVHSSFLLNDVCH